MSARRSTIDHHEGCAATETRGVSDPNLSDQVLLLILQRLDDGFRHGESVKTVQKRLGHSSANC